MNPSRKVFSSKLVNAFIELVDGLRKVPSKYCSKQWIFFSQNKLIKKNTNKSKFLKLLSFSIEVFGDFY